MSRRAVIPTFPDHSMVPSLTLLTWPDYINPHTLAQFEEEYGAAVQVELVPSAVELLERMQAAASGVDVLVPPDYAVRELITAGRLAVLDQTLLPNLEHLHLHFRDGRAHDPDTRFSIIKDWGTTGFMYRSDRLSRSLTSWADFWTAAAEVTGCVTVLDSPGEVIGAALKMRGHSYNASSPNALAKALEDLLSLMPHLLAFETNYKPLLSSGEAVLSLGWNGDAAALLAQGVPVRYVVPEEGTQILEDDWAIAADAPHPELAHQFLNFVLRPDVAAQEARYTRYATGNRSAFELLEDDLRKDTSTYPPEEVLRQLEAGMPLDAGAQQRREELWSEIRSHGQGGSR